MQRWRRVQGGEGQARISRAGAARQSWQGGLGKGTPRPGGGWAVAVVAEKKVRLGFVVMGVPSSSSRVGGDEVMGCEP